MTYDLDSSRREFLAASAVGLLGITSLVREMEHSDDARLIYVGTYTENGRRDGIHLVRFDPRTGALRLVGSVDAGANPSFLALHPNGRVLYAVNEVTEREGKASGGVSAFAVARGSGALTRINEQASEGGAPCYVSVDRGGRYALVANYVGGNVALLPIAKDGSLGVAAQVIQHSGKGPNAERQEAAHAHCVVPDPSNRFALAADLGMDRVLVYRMQLERGSLEHVASGDATARPGAGPRHLAFHPTLPLVYVANELDSTVTSLRFDRERGALSPVQTLSALPDGWKGESFAADIHLTSDGRTLYASNRGHNSIAVFQIDLVGALKLEQTISTGGDWPRNFTLDPSGRWLLVANQRSGSIVVLARDQKTGRLTETSQRLDVASPVCLQFQRGQSG